MMVMMMFMMMYRITGRGVDREAATRSMLSHAIIIIVIIIVIDQAYDETGTAAVVRAAIACTADTDRCFSCVRHTHIPSSSS